MQRGERDHRVDLGERLFGDACRRGEAATAMHNTVRGSGDLIERDTTRDQPVKQAVERLVVVSCGDVLLFVAKRHPACAADTCDVAFNDKLKRGVKHRDLDGAIRKIAANSILEEEQISKEMIDNILQEYNNCSQGNISVKSIKKVISTYFSIKVSLFSEANRSKDVAKARQIAMYFSKTLTSLSLPKIGKEFNKNHATVLYAVKAIEKEMEKDASFSNLIEKLRLQISQ